MELKNYNVYFFFIILAVATAAAFFILKPFLTALAVAAILAAVFQRPYKYFLKITRNRKGTSAILTSILIILIIVIPFFLVIGLVAGEVASLVKTISTEGSTLGNQFSQAVQYIRNLPVIQSFNLEESFEQEEIIGSLKNIGQGALAAIQKAYQSVVHFVFMLFVMLFSLYYFFIDGRRVINKIMYLSPLKDVHEELLVEKFISISRSTLKSMIAVGLVQGTIGALVFAIAGVSSPVLWGAVMAVFSVIPLAGTGIIWVPAGIIMIFLGNIWEGVFILAVGGGVISTIDNLLRPKLVGRDTQMHPLLIFFSILGGIAFVGISGFIIGPILVAFFLTLWEIYAVEFKGQLNKYNV